MRSPTRILHASHTHPQRARRRRWLLAVLAASAAALMQPAVPAPALSPGAPGSSAGWVSHVPTVSRGPVTAALAREQSVRAAVATGSVRSSLSAAAGQASTPDVQLPAISPEHYAGLSVLPVEQRLPVAGLRAAAEAAAGMLGPLPATDVHAVGREWLRQLIVDPPARASGDEDSRPASGSAPAPVAPALEAVSGPLPATVARAVEHAPAAALLLATAIDAYVPSLQRAMGESEPLSGSARLRGASGCDVVDQLPVLCVASAVSNELTADAMVLVDLGGDDVYRNTAGGAPFPLPDGDTYAPVSVNIDLGGNDLYSDAARPVSVPGVHAGGNVVPTVGAMVITQGAALYGSVGLLLDAGGNDVYAAQAPATDADRAITSVLAQGGGVAGVGGLFDLGGSDSYTTTAPAGNGASTAAAQGVGMGHCEGSWTERVTRYYCNQALELGGILVDRGVGDDRYGVVAGEAVGAALEESDTAFGDNLAPTRAALGQAAGSLSFGVVTDDGGDDAFTVEVSATGPAPWEGTADRYPPVVVVRAQASGGNALLLTGGGDTRYSIISRGVDRVGWQVTHGQAHNSWPFQPEGSAILSDSGGDDSYSLRTSLVAQGHTVVTGGAASRGVDFAAVIGGLDTMGQASAVWGTSFLLDGAGDDTYQFEHVSHAAASLSDERTDPAAPSARLRVGGHWSPTVVGQGAAWREGAAFLVDAGGNDDYGFRASATTHAQSDAEDAHVTATSQRMIVYGQGASRGGDAAGLVDLGGQGDRVLAEAVNTATTFPDGDGAFQRPVLARFHGSNNDGAGAGVLKVLGSDPQIVSRPSQPVCRQELGARRGFGTWDHCDTVWVKNNAAGGTAPLSAGDYASLTLSVPDAAPLDFHSEPTPAAERVPVEARVTTSDGAAVPGATVHFTLIGRAPVVNGVEAAQDVVMDWQVDVVADAQGIASAELPLLGTAYTPYPGTEYFVAASFDGRGGADPLRPEHAEAALFLTD